jgi:ClpP class serine protease
LTLFCQKKKEDIDQIKTIQKDLHGQFINWVKKRRGKRLKAKDTELFNAGIWSGVKSKELGLIDGIGDYYTIMKATFGEDIKFKDFSKKNLMDKAKVFFF